jgi:UDP-galactopyranose mutase
MDVTIREALDCGRRYLATLETGEKMPAFTVNPL